MDAEPERGPGTDGAPAGLSSAAERAPGLRGLRKRWWLPVAVLLVGGGAAWAVVHAARPPAEVPREAEPPGPRRPHRPRGTHPEFDWTGTLRQALRDADRLEVYAFPPREKDLPPRCVIEGKKEVADLVNGLDLDPEWSGPACMCLGYLELRFLKGGVVAARVNVKTEDALWWQQGAWPGDGFLREGSARELAARLAAAGCPDVQKDRAEVMATLRHEGEARK